MNITQTERTVSITDHENRLEKFLHSRLGIGTYTPDKTTAGVLRSRHWGEYETPHKRGKWYVEAVLTDREVVTVKLVLQPEYTGP